MKKIISLIVVIFLGCSAYGENLSWVDIEEEKDSLTLPEWKELKKEYLSPIMSRTLVDKSSLYELIGLFLHPQAKFTYKERKWIENLFNTFSDSIVNNDTTAFYVHSVVKLKYYECIKKDYRKVLNIWNVSREQYGEPPIANNLSEWMDNLFSYYPAPFDYFSKSRIEKKMYTKRSIDAWTGLPITYLDDYASIHIPLDLSLRTYIFLFGIYKKNGWSYPISLYETINHNRHDILKMILAYWDVLNVKEVQRNILLCGLLSHSKDKKNEQAFQYLKSLFPPEHLHDYEEFYKSGKSELVDWEGLHAAILGGWLGISNDSTYQSSLYAIENIFGKASEEYYYIAKNKILSKEEYKEIVEKDIREGVNDSVTSFNIVKNILEGYDLLNEYENICQNCIVYEKYIRDEHLGDFYYY